MCMKNNNNIFINILINSYVSQNNTYYSSYILNSLFITYLTLFVLNFKLYIFNNNYNKNFELQLKKNKNIENKNKNNDNLLYKNLIFILILNKYINIVFS